MARKDDPVAFVTGELGGTVAYTYKLLYNWVDPECVQGWTMTYPAGPPSDTPNAGVKVFIGEKGVFITGWSNQGSTGMDALTVRYANP